MTDERPPRSARSGAFLDPDGRTLPERIRHRRRQRGLRSNALARALDVSPSYVTMIERGRKVPSEELAAAIAEILDDDPELYLAWIHSTRFSDPETTLRGFQRLYYSGPPAKPEPSPMSSPSRRASWMLRNMASSRADAFRASIDCRLAFAAAAPDELYQPTAPLIALGTGGARLTFWRLPWLAVEDDPRPTRFVVAPTPDPERLIVATPEQFEAVVLVATASDSRNAAAWRGWRPEGTDPNGGACTLVFDADGALAPLLRERTAFLDSLGPEIDVVAFDGGRVAVRRQTRAELERRLDSQPVRGPV